MKQFIHDWIHLTQGEMFIKYWHLWLLMLLIVLLILVVIVWWHDDIFKQIRDKQWQEDDSVGRKNINTELSTNITLDTAKAQRAFDLLDETVEQIKGGERAVKQPHVRIEFDDIRDVPKVWVDGELMDDGANDKSLVSLKVDWNTDTATENHKGFDINYYDLTGERPMSRGLREGSVM
ncbi:hypothetical protein [Leuconostoc suionicum]|uniref:hypothetical protein n=1 Tax=Leuconostoc suionicum TaxID=1511761 RepID=UPI0032DEE614